MIVAADGSPLQQLILGQTAEILRRFHENALLPAAVAVAVELRAASAPAPSQRLGWENAEAMPLLR